jgi:hypothetical protein
MFLNQNTCSVFEYHGTSDSEMFVFIYNYSVYTSQLFLLRTWFVFEISFYFLDVSFNHSNEKTSSLCPHS